jgi:hypothetical protein
MSMTGWTYPSAKLKYVLNRIIKELDDAVGKPNYANIKPVDVMVITDMAPSMRVLVYAREYILSNHFTS